MKLYADTPGRRTAQILADVLFVLWLVLWVWVGNRRPARHDGPGRAGRQTAEAATSLSAALTRRGRLPQRACRSSATTWPRRSTSASASDALAEAGRGQVAAVERLVLWLGISIAAIPILMRRRRSSAAAMAVRPAGDSRRAVHRRGRGPRPVRAARPGPAADARAGQGQRRPRRRVARPRPRGRPGARRLELRACGLTIPARLASPVCATSS